MLNHDGRVLRLIGGLLSMCHLGRTGRAVRPMPFHVSSLLGHIMSNTARPVGSGNLLFRRRFANAGMIMGNSISEVRRIVGGLVTGTIGFASSKRVTFGIGCSRNMLMVGIGSANMNVSRRLVGHVCVPFRHTTGTSGTSKCNLKLPVTGNVIAVVNKAVSIGDALNRKAAFAMALPLPVASRTIRSRGTPVSSALRLPGGIVIVSSSMLRLRLIGRVLRHGNMSYAVYDGISGLARRVHGGGCSLLLASVRVPGASNFGLLRLLHGSHVNGSGRVPIITVATHDRDRHRSLLGTNFSKYVFGPFSVGRLLEIATSIVGKHRPNDRASFSVVLTGISGGEGVLEAVVRSYRGSVLSLGLTVAGRGERSVQTVTRHVFPV